MNIYPSYLQRLIESFSRFPGIGEKTAARFSFYLLKLPQKELDELAELIKNLRLKTKSCAICHNFSETDPCSICCDQKRTKNIICVVNKPQDLVVIEKSGQYKGLYHVLGGVLNPLNNITPENLNVKSLIERIKNSNATINEIIISLNPDIEGETTTLYLNKLLKKYFPQIRVTRLARGLPMGSDIEYADDITISNALNGRKEL